MKFCLTFIIIITFKTIGYSQKQFSINSGAVSNNTLIHSVGEIFVNPVNEDEKCSGLIGSISRIEFFVVGINEILISDDLKAYPNPIENKLFFETDKTIDQFFIYNAQGQLVDTKNNKNNKIDLTNLEAGTYIVKTNIQNLKTITIIKK